MIEIEINGRKIKARKGDLILDTLKANGIHVPSLCNMEGFKPSGACRICVVEAEGRDDLIPSCSHYVEEGMKILTHSARVIRARKTILELLLSNHDDGCLSCDRSRWCKLQELAAELNVTERRFSGRPQRRKIDYTSQAIIRDPSKCILCSRCVRVCEETQHVAALDFLYRGSRTEVGTVLGKGLNYTSCMDCGQCIQVCPTGALRERSHLDPVGALLQDHDKIAVALIDPSVYAVLGEFYGYKAGQEFSSILVNTLRRIGFKKVFGTGWGLEYQAGQVAGLLTGLSGVSDDNPLLVSECPSFVKYICQSRPDLIPFLIPLVPSPVLMTGLIRESLSNATGKPEKDIRVVYLTGCTASKTGTAFGMKTSESGQLPDYSLTTREVYRLIRLFGVYPPSLGADAQEDQFSNGSRTGFMGAISGGYIEVLSRILQSRYPGSQVNGDKPGKLRTGRDVREITCETDHFKFSLSSVSGLTGFENYYTEIRTKKRKVDILEVMACQHGCINGGGQPCRGHDRNLRNRLKGVMEWDEKFSGLRMREQLDLPQGVALTEEKTHVVHRHRQIIK